MTAPAPIDVSGIIPPQFSSQVIQEATETSAALRLGQKVPMGTTVNEMPVPKAFPKAAWVSVGGRKPFTDLKLSNEELRAEEIAAVISIPDAQLEDSSINLWNFCRPLLAQAIAMGVDDAILFGIDAPASFPDGGVVGNATAVATGSDAVDTINQTMSAVETQGLRVTGDAADLAVLGALRGVRDNNGALLLGNTQVNGRSVDTIYGVPVAYSSFTDVSKGDFIAGNWNYLMIGVRQDIRYQMSKDGVLVDDTGKVVVSAFQDNQTLMKVWARFGCVLISPVTARRPNGANPFAVSTVAGTATPP